MADRFRGEAAAARVAEAQVRAVLLVPAVVLSVPAAAARSVAEDAPFSRARPARLESRVVQVALRSRSRPGAGAAANSVPDFVTETFDDAFQLAVGKEAVRLLT